MITTKKDKYFEHLCLIIDGENYHSVLSHLDNIEFTTIIKRDEIQLENVLKFRYNNGGMRMTPPSVFEVMVSLAVDAERKTMHVTAAGNRTAEWFWLMMRNLDFHHYTDDEYDENIADEVDETIDIMLAREYDRNGCGGGLFHTTTRKDMRKLDVWRQCMCNLSDLYSDELRIDVV